MNFHWFIAKRYLWSKRRHPFVGVVSTISILGITVGVAALITVLAVMNGFDEDLKSRILGLRSHLVVEKEGVFDDFAAAGKTARSVEDVTGVSPYVEGQALFQVGEWGSGVIVRGVDVQTEKTVSNFFKNIQSGILSDAPDGIVVGNEMAQRAHLVLGSEVLLATQSTKKPLLFRVEGIFSSGMYEYDANIVFLNLKNAQALFNMNGAVTGLSINLKEAEYANEAKKEIQQKLGYPHITRTWIDMNRTLFSALKLEKIVMFLILALIILVACLNIAGCLTILVMNKTKDIGVLKALGATRMDLMKIFAADGLALGLAGAAAGFAVGMGICYALKNTNLVELPKEIYYMDRLPVTMNTLDVVTVLLVAVGLSFVSSLYPAVVAGRLNPVKALRYE